MFLILSLNWIFLSICLGFTAQYYEYQYSLKRDLLQEKEREFSGYFQHLTEDEKIVSNYLEYLKWQEFERTRTHFLPSRPIKDVLSDLKSSNVYRVLKKLPKAGNMHLHHNHVLSKEKFLEIIMNSPIYDHLYVKTTGSDYGKLDFYVNPPNGWENVKANSSYYTKDRLLQRLTFLNVMNDTVLNSRTDSGLRWKVMQPLFGFAGSRLINHANITALYMQEVLRSALDENVQYLETKASAYKKTYILDDDSIYNNLHGKHYIGDDNGELELQTISKVIQDFGASHPEFIGYKRIINSYRGTSEQNMGRDMLRALHLYKKYPNLIGGFDMVGEEDRGYSLIHFMDDFADIAAQNGDLPYYLHVAETNWPDDLLTSLHSDDPFGTLENVYEAVILKSKRVGHGLGFIKHPYLLEVLKNRKIAIEANPVSNMLLGYVPDQRHHPAITYLRYGIPVVLGSDDPGTFGYNEFTVDWYEAFMAWGLNLADLKQLANNSLTYSAMSDSEKIPAFAKWSRSWDKFIVDMKQEACTSIQRTDPIITEIYPSEGAIRDGTKVRVFGRHFQSAICKTILCRFGNVVSKGSYIFNQMITCDSPKRVHPRKETVSFSVSIDNGTSFHLTNKTFTYAHLLSPTDIDVTSVLVG